MERFFNRFVVALTASVIFTGLPTLGKAGPIVSAVSATADVATRSGWFLTSLINQQGLSTGYLSGVTDFDSYISSNPTHDNRDSTMWGANNGVTNATLTFDLGGAMSIESFALWNRGFSSQGVNAFSLSASNTADFSVSTALGSFNATAVVGTGSATLPEVFSFSPTSVAYLRMTISSFHGSCCITMGEVAFEKSEPTIAEPTTLALMGLGLAGIGVVRKKKQA